jgi:hypothetical protein
MKISARNVLSGTAAAYSSSLAASPDEPAIRASRVNRSAPIFQKLRQITLLPAYLFIVGVCAEKGYAMLFLAAISRVIVPRDPESQSGDLSVRSRLGHVGLTVIALVYVLVSLWQR